ncbi:unnamed protein product, partial [Sphenostylis stenocarpa]
SNIQIDDKNDENDKLWTTNCVNRDVNDQFIEENGKTRNNTKTMHKSWRRDV